MKLINYKHDFILNYLDNNEIKTPRFILLPVQIRYNLDYFLKKLQIPAKNLYYSVKTNNHPEFLKTVNNFGSGFEIASLNEWSILKKLDVHASKVLFSNPVKIPEHIKKTYNDGVRLFVFDTESELIKLKKHASESKLIMRIEIENTGAEWSLEHKFGVSVNEAFGLANKCNKLKMKLEGITFHVGWNNSNTKNWKNLILKINDILNKWYKNGIKLKFVNLGGGFPAHNNNQYYELEKISRTIINGLKQIESLYKVKIVAEPGSFIANNTMFFVMRIYDIIYRKSENWIFVDSGIMQGFSWILSGLQFPLIYPYEFKKDATLKKFTITGPTNDSKDIFGKIMLPDSVKIGDYIIIYPAGAYTISSSNYNGFTIPETIVLNDY